MQTLSNEAESHGFVGLGTVAGQPASTPALDSCAEKKDTDTSALLATSQLADMRFNTPRSPVQLTNVHVVLYEAVHAGQGSILHAVSLAGEDATHCAGSIGKSVVRSWHVTVRA